MKFLNILVIPVVCTACYVCTAYTVVDLAVAPIYRQEVDGRPISIEQPGPPGLRRPEERRLRLLLLLLGGLLLAEGLLRGLSLLLLQHLDLLDPGVILDLVQGLLEVLVQFALAEQGLGALPVREEEGVLKKETELN